MLALLLGAPGLARAQSPAVPTDAPSSPSAGWQACAAITGDSTARLTCFDNWARSQAVAGTAASAANHPVPSSGPTIPATPAIPATPRTLEAAAPPATLPPTPHVVVNIDGGCHAGQYSNLARFWELESGTDCGVFGIRGYRPMTLGVVFTDSVNTQPTSPAAGRSATTSTPYRRTENRIQLSVRTKILQGILTGDAPQRDSLWFGYTQQSYWQLFTPQLSRPFRSTDHEPELIYVFPTDYTLPLGWRMRYNGVGLVHQSNGQSLPLSRSWNRVYLMAGMENGDRFSVTGRIWQRLNEKTNDDNPDISDYIGRAELSAYWNVNKDNTLGVTVRHSLQSQANGSVRLEWLRALGGDAGGGGSSSPRTSGLRFHTQLFTGYGDSLIDYNRRRTVFSVGLSLVDF